MRILFFLLFPLSLFAESSILVHLETDEMRIPVYISHFSKDSSISPDLIQELEQTLQFDLNHNGVTKVIRNSPDLDVLCKPSILGQTDTLSTWKALDIVFVLTATIQNKELAIQIFDFGTQVIHSLSPLSLEGDPLSDRRKMHHLSNSLLKLLFGKEGIATTKILFTLKQKDQLGHEIAELWEMDYDGRGARPVTREKTLIVTPSYLPSKEGEARQAFYVSYKNGIPKIKLIDLDQRSPGKTISQLRGNQLMPTLSPQCNQIAFISDAAGNPDLFIQPFAHTGAKGKPRQIYAVPFAAQASPSFSPDGKQIAFVSNKDGRPRIYTLTIPPSKNSRASNPSYFNHQTKC